MQETADTNASKDDINKNDVLEDAIHNKHITQKRNKRKAMFDGMYSTKIYQNISLCCIRYSFIFVNRLTYLYLYLS